MLRRRQGARGGVAKPRDERAALGNYSSELVELTIRFLGSCSQSFAIGECDTRTVRAVLSNESHERLVFSWVGLNRERRNNRARASLARRSFRSSA